MADLRSRLAVPADVPALTTLMDAAIMGIDTQLIDDGTYFSVVSGGTMAFDQ